MNAPPLLCSECGSPTDALATLCPGCAGRLVQALQAPPDPVPETLQPVTPSELRILLRPRCSFDD